MHIFGYIDLGTGAFVWQSIIGVFVGVLFYLRKTRQWIGRIMGKIFRIGQKPGVSPINLAVDKENKVEADHF